MALPRILYSVPKLPHVQWEIAKAIRTLGLNDTLAKSQRSNGPHTSGGTHDLAAEAICEFLHELCKAGFRPDQPRWPSGSGDISGRWSGGAGEGPQAPPKPPPAEAPPHYWGIGHNQGPPLDDPPEIPEQQRLDESAINDFMKAAGKWLFKAGVRRVLEVGLEATIGGPVGNFLLAMEAAYWLKSYLPYIQAYLDAPKTWEELQQNAGTGYDEHHIVERWSKNDGIPQSLIDASYNRVEIPTLVHWEINSWLGKPNGQFKDANDKSMSPRDYMRGKTWEERYRFGLDVLRRFGVLKP